MMTFAVYMGKSILNFLFMLTPIFICIGLMDTWIERDMMIRILGESTGQRGALLSMALGMVTAVPLYALLPVAGMLIKKGCSIFNALVFLGASASIRVPLLFFEITSLGWRFTALRFVLNIVVVYAIAGITDRLLSDAEKGEIYKQKGDA